MLPDANTQGAGIVGTCNLENGTMYGFLNQVKGAMNPARSVIYPGRKAAQVYTGENIASKHMALLKIQQGAQGSLL